MTKSNGKHHDEIVIPEKLYFRIGEVAHLLGLETYVLRFWETEFPQLKPSKSSTGQRMYRRREVELAVRVKDLLYNQGFTIAGARQHLKAEAKPSAKQTALFQAGGVPISELKRVRQGLKEILGVLGAKNSR